MLCRAKDLPGYWFKNQTGIPVPHGEGRMLLEIPVQPAGAVYGR